MKKTIALLLMLALMLAAVPALAEGKLEVLQENSQIYSPYAVLIAKVMNVGDEPMEVLSTLDMYDNDGEVFWSGDYVLLGDVLQPGEYTYAYFCAYLYGDTTMTRYTSSLEGVAASGFAQTVRYASRAELALEGEDYDETCILVYFTNTTDEIIFQPSASGVLLDTDGNLLYLSVPVEYDLGIPPGSTVIFQCEIPPYVLRALDLDHLVLDSAVYTNKSF